MAEQSSFRILLIVLDNSLALQIIQTIKSHFAQLPIQTDVAQNAARGISEFREKLHPLIIIEHSIPGMEISSFISEIRRIDGGASILILGGDGENGFGLGVYHVSMPIVNWTEFTAIVEQSISDETKARFGLQKRNTIFYEKLLKYAQQYRKQPQDKALAQEPVLLIPSFFEHRSETDSSVNQAEQEKPQETTVFIELSEKVRKKYLKFEISLLAVLLSITLLVYWFSSEEAGFFSLKSFFTLLTVFSFFGFFLSKAFDRFLLGQKVLRTADKPPEPLPPK